MDLFDMSDEEKIKSAYKLLREVRDFVNKCFSFWGWPPNRIVVADRLLVERMVKDYDEQAVRQGFITARGEGIEKLSYVRGIARKDFESRCAEKSMDEGQKLKIDLGKKDFFEPTEDAKNWKNMFDEVLNKFKEK